MPRITQKKDAFRQGRLMQYMAGKALVTRLYSRDGNKALSVSVIAPDDHSTCLEFEEDGKTINSDFSHWYLKLPGTFEHDMAAFRRRQKETKLVLM